MFKLNHVALTVSDRETSAHFYERFFSLTNRVHEDDHLLILAGEDGGLLVLSHGSVPQDLPRTNHFGFQVETAQDVLALRKKFAEAGVEETEFQEKSPTRVQVFDPDKNRVEVYAF